MPTGLAEGPVAGAYDDNLMLDEFLGGVIAASGAPGVSVAVWREGATTTRAIGASAIGVRPLAVEDQFPIGCVIKPLIALLCCELHVRGTIDVSQPVARYVPNMKRMPPITVADLLSHTAGYVEPSGAGDRFTMDWAGFEEFYRGTAQAFEPGKVWSYSQTGYCILGRLVEASLQRELEEVISTELLIPLGISDIRASRVTVSPHIQVRATGGLQRIRLPPETGLYGASISRRAMSTMDLLQVGTLISGLQRPAFLSREALSLFSEPVIGIPRTAGSVMAEHTPSFFGRGLGHYGSVVGTNGTVVGSTCAIRFDPKANIGVSVALNAWQPGLRDYICSRLLAAMGSGESGLAGSPGADPELADGIYVGLMLGLGTAEVRTEDRATSIIVRNEGREPSRVSIRRDRNGAVELISSDIEGLPVGIGGIGDGTYLQLGASAYARMAENKQLLSAPASAPH
jgi:CubicO group peptidase (beta-lactamase class C family)